MRKPEKSRRRHLSASSSPGTSTSIGATPTPQSSGLKGWLRENAVFVQLLGPSITCIGALIGFCAFNHNVTMTRHTAEMAQARSEVESIKKQLESMSQARNQELLILLNLVDPKQRA